MKLFIASPTGLGLIQQSFALGLLDTIAKLPKDWTVEIHLYPGSILYALRNDLAARFLASDCTHILWIDSDQVFKAEDVFALCDTAENEELDWIAGFTPHKCDELTVPISLPVPPPENPSHLAQAATAGHPFTLVSRRAYHNLINHHWTDDILAVRPYNTDYGKAWGFYTPFQSHGKLFGEDIAFCYRWVASGGHIWIHQGVSVGHIGFKQWRTDSLEKAVHLYARKANNG